MYFLKNGKHYSTLSDLIDEVFRDEEVDYYGDDDVDNLSQPPNETEERNEM